MWTIWFKPPAEDDLQNLMTAVTTASILSDLQLIVRKPKVMTASNRQILGSIRAGTFFMDFTVSAKLISCSI